MSINSDDVSRAKSSSIVDYLSRSGHILEKNGNKYYCQSPFSYDRTPSFCVYPTNTFYDWSNGFGGDIIKLVSEIHGIGFQDSVNLINNGDIPIFIKSDAEVVQQKEFNIEKYLSVNKNEELLIRRYAFDRAIIRNFKPSVFIVNDGEEFIRRPSVGYVHVDDNFNECGIKMRDINPYKDRRFSARGSQKFYILSNSGYSPLNPLYIVESESSANSLFEFLCCIGKAATVVSFGSWSNIPRYLPDGFNKNDKRSIIIDYDGNEELYQERIAKFEHLNAREIRLELQKNEDMNSLFKSGKIVKYKHHF